jgi:CDP-diacylglycerol--serine O-phosphatidyltransferase
MTIFLLFGIIFYFGLILVYTINAILISGIIYLAIIPASYLHYKNLNNKFRDQVADNEEEEDIL